METEKQATIYLTDQVKGHPNIKKVSREIMFSVADFYKKPRGAWGFRKKNFTDYHRLAEDSGGFQFLMGKLTNPDPLRTVQIYKRIGVTREDFPIQLDLPPRFDLNREQRMALIVKSAEFYWRMVEHIDWVVPVVHGWTLEELKASLELLENPEKLGSATYNPSATRTLDKMVKGTSRVMASDSHFSSLGVGTYFGVAGGSQFIIDHVTSNNSVAVGGYQQSGMFVCDHIANTPSRIEKKALACGSNKITPVVVDNVISSRPRSKVISAPNGDVGTVVVEHVVSSRPRNKALGVGANLQSGRYVLDETGNRKKPKVTATPHQVAERVVHRVPRKVVLERLALVLNLLRDRELFILGGASPNDQHLIFMGGARYSDTSAWRLKAYLGEIYIPEVGSRAVGYKAKVKRLSAEETVILQECLNDSTHPLAGLKVDYFLELVHYNMADWRKTLKAKEWPIKPFDARALHNAWVIKRREEVIANEYANDPDRYHKYLRKRFEGHPNLTRKLKRLWRMLKRPYVQDSLTAYLKGRKVGKPTKQGKN